ncbi:MAG: hypothetical protein AAF685_18040 [Cyanobacteria bacterium P01_C01_bin.89]
MQTIAILHIPTPDGTPTYRAISGNKQTQGNTAGQALDALTAQLSDQPFGGTILLQSFRPDPHFTEAQQTRLAELMTAWRTARDNDQPFDETLQTELDALTLAELQATGERSMTLLSVIAP